MTSGTHAHQGAVRWPVLRAVVCAAVVSMTQSAFAVDRPLTAAGCHSPSSSPVSDAITYVGYSVRADGRLVQDLYVSNLDGTGTRRLSEASVVWDPSFNHDGSAIICSAVGLDTPEFAALWLIAVSSGTPRQLVRYGADTAPFAPAFAPDGGMVVFIRTEDETARRAAIWTLDPLRGVTEVFPLHHTLTLSQSGGLMWMPDSTHVRFLAVEDRGAEKRMGLFEMDVRKGEGKVKSVHVFGPGEVISDPAMSPDGKKLAYVRRQGATGELMVLEEGAAEPRPLAHVDIPERRIARPFESDVCFTRDSAGVVYVSGLDLRLVDLSDRGRASAPVYVEDCQQNLKELREALRRFSVAHGGNLPAPPDDRELDPDFWVAEIRPVLDKPARLKCPSDRSNAVTSYVFPREMYGRSYVEVAATQEILLRERDAHHGGTPLYILGDGTIAQPERQ